MLRNLKQGKQNNYLDRIWRLWNSYELITTRRVTSLRHKNGSE